MFVAILSPQLIDNRGSDFTGTDPSVTWQSVNSKFLMFLIQRRGDLNLIISPNLTPSMHSEKWMFNALLRANS